MRHTGFPLSSARSEDRTQNHDAHMKPQARQPVNTYKDMFISLYDNAH